MDFGWAINALKAGHKVTRKGWNGNRPVSVPPYPKYIPKDKIAVDEAVELVYIKMRGDKVTVIDMADYDKVKGLSFSLDKGGYAIHTFNEKTPRTTRKLHQLLLPDVPAGYVVDHINGDRLDNRRCNLRIVTAHMNVINSKSRSNTSSKYKGVSFDTSRGKWISSIQVKGITKHIGRFASEEEAAKAYDKRAFELYGEYARLNFPEIIQSMPRMYLWLMPATTVKAEWCKEPVLKRLAEENGGEIECLGTIRMFTHDSTGRNAILTGWLASQSDMLAEDWDYAGVSPEDEQRSIAKLPRAGSMENCDKLSNSINQLLDTVTCLPNLNAYVEPGPDNKELTITIREEGPTSDSVPVHVGCTFHVTRNNLVACHVINPDDITKTSIGSPVKNIKTVAGGYEVEDMQSNLGKKS